MKYNQHNLYISVPTK